MSDAIVIPLDAGLGWSAGTAARWRRVAALAQPPLASSGMPPSADGTRSRQPDAQCRNVPWRTRPASVAVVEPMGL